MYECFVILNSLMSQKVRIKNLVRFVVFGSVVVVGGKHRDTLLKKIFSCTNLIMHLSTCQLAASYGRWPPFPPLGSPDSTWRVDQEFQFRGQNIGCKYILKVLLPYMVQIRDPWNVSQFKLKKWEIKFETGITYCLGIGIEGFHLVCLYLRMEYILISISHFNKLGHVVLSRPFLSTLRHPKNLKTSEGPVPGKSRCSCFQMECQ